MFDYTTSEPPRYELLPDTMHEIIHQYMKYRDPYGTIWLSHKYPFPDMEGLKSDGLIGRWISGYLALLLLRQYTIFPYLITMKPLDFPISPKKQSQKRLWISNLDFFNKLLKEHIENATLLEDTILKFITKEWCKENAKPYPTDFMAELKSRLETDYEQQAVNLEIAEEKKASFFTSSKEILENTLNLYTQIANPQELSGEVNRWYVNGGRMVDGKDAFSETPEVDHLNFDTFLAHEVAREIRDGVLSTILYSRTKSYLLKPEDIFHSIDKLQATTDYVIVAIDLDITDYISRYSPEGLVNNKYKAIPIITLTGNHLLNHCLIILHKHHLPFIKTVAPKEEVITKYSLQRISDKFEIFASILDLNAVPQEIRDENMHGKSDADLKKSVLLNLLFDVEISWNKGVEVIHLLEYSEYREIGVANSLADVIPISKR